MLLTPGGYKPVFALSFQNGSLKCKQREITLNKTVCLLQALVITESLIWTIEAAKTAYQSLLRPT